MARGLPLLGVAILLLVPDHLQQTVRLLTIHVGDLCLGLFASRGLLLVLLVLLLLLLILGLLLALLILLLLLLIL
ncbi:MAG: hypothetical protein EBQ99_08195, partial [Planctomycetes bacterium]|nr:hypothetical protein [Planctomycetota bacterium]